MRGPGPAARHARLDLTEDEGPLTGRHEVELARAAAEVALEHAVARTLEVLCGEALSQGAESATGVHIHEHDATPTLVTHGWMSVTRLEQEAADRGTRLSPYGPHPSVGAA